MKICPKCNAENIESNKFCSECGMPIKEGSTITNAPKKSKKVIKKAIIIVVVIVLLIFGIYEAYIWIYWGGMSKESRDTWKEFGDTMSSVQQVYDDAETKYNALTFDRKDRFTNAYSHSDIEDYTISLFKIECEVTEIISKKGKEYECIIRFDNQLFYVDYINTYENIELNENDKITLYGIMRTTSDMYLSDSNTELRKIDASYIEK